MYIKASLEKYIEDLSAKLPAPGGGSASAACGALGVALILMVSNFTIGKEKHAAYQDEIKEIVSKAEGLRKILLELVDKDVKAYEEFSRVYKMPKEERGPILQDALKEALSVPIEICKVTCEAIKLTEPLLTKGNKSLISDVGVAASMLHSAFESAKMNVDINLRDIEDRAVVNRVREDITEMFGEVRRIKDTIILAVNNKLGPYVS